MRTSGILFHCVGLQIQVQLLVMLIALCFVWPTFKAINTEWYQALRGLGQWAHWSTILFLETPWWSVGALVYDFVSWNAVMVSGRIGLRFCFLKRRGQWAHWSTILFPETPWWRCVKLQHTKSDKVSSYELCPPHSWWIYPRDWPVFVHQFCSLRLWRNPDADWRTSRWYRGPCQLSCRPTISGLTYMFKGSITRVSYASLKTAWKCRACMRVILNSEG